MDGRDADDPVPVAPRAAATSPGERAPERAPEPAAERAPVRTERSDKPVERDPRDRDGDGLPDTLRQRLEALVPEIVKRTFAAGMGAVFSTEEGIRKLAKDNLPAAAGYIASSADRGKDKVLEVIARETREFLQTMNFTEEIAKILTTLSFEIKTEIRFIPNSERYGGVEPDVKARVRLKRQDRSDAKSDKADDDKDRPSRLKFWRRGEGDRERERGDGPDVEDPLDPEE